MVLRRHSDEVNALVALHSLPLLSADDYAAGALALVDGRPAIYFASSSDDGSVKVWNIKCAFVVMMEFGTRQPGDFFFGLAFHYGRLLATTLPIDEGEEAGELLAQLAPSPGRTLVNEGLARQMGGRAPLGVLACGETLVVSTPVRS